MCLSFIRCAYIIAFSC
uniref:Uncharacterized protein n=1 Tax=Anguilla anguilla TaxID=7936 RepID=A0A0E9SXP1_ANGAN